MMRVYYLHSGSTTIHGKAMALIGTRDLRDDGL